MYRAHLAAMTVETSSPIRRKHFRLTERQANGVARLLAGGTFTQRELQEHLGMSLGAANNWVRTMWRAGLFRVQTKRGRFGYTRLIPVRGIRRHGLNVQERPPVVESNRRVVLKVVPTPLNIRPLATVADGLSAWLKLRESL